MNNKFRNFTFKYYIINQPKFEQYTKSCFHMYVYSIQEKFCRAYGTFCAHSKHLHMSNVEDYLLHIYEK